MTSPAQKVQPSPPKVYSGRNVKTNSSSMIPVLSPERDNRVCHPLPGGNTDVNGGDGRVEDASVSVPTTSTGMWIPILPQMI